MMCCIIAGRFHPLLSAINFMRGIYGMLYVFLWERTLKMHTLEAECMCNARKLPLWIKTYIFYCQREDSTMHLMKLSAHIDGVKILLQECEFLCSRYPNLRTAINVKALQAIELEEHPLL